MMSNDHANVLITKSGLQDLVSLLKSPVPMEESGISQFMHVFAQQEPSLMSTNVIKFLFVKVEKFITLLTTNVNVLTG